MLDCVNSRIIKDATLFNYVTAPTFVSDKMTGLSYVQSDSEYANKFNLPKMMEYDALHQLSEGKTPTMPSRSLLYYYVMYTNANPNPDPKPNPNCKSTNLILERYFPKTDLTLTLTLILTLTLVLSFSTNGLKPLKGMYLNILLL
jgi:hypothetical protein